MVSSRFRQWLLGLGATLLATSCSLLGPAPNSPVPEEYLLQWNPPEHGDRAVQANPACPILLLSSPRAASGYTSTGMVYIEEPHRIDHFAHHRWADSPPRMLEPLLMRALESSGLFHAVLSAPAIAQFDLRLDTELLQLAQVFGAGESRVELSVRFSLFDVHRQRVLVIDVLEETEPAALRSPEGGVVAANRAVARLLERLQRLLRPFVESRCASTGPKG